MPTVIAFDFGTKRIGVAVGETEMRIPHPLPAICSERNEARFAAIAALFEQWQPALCVVGLPLAVDGSEHAMTQRARRFAQRLQGRFGVKIDLVDERYTSASASIDLRSAGANERETERSIDAVAACEILSAWFDSIHVNNAGTLGKKDASPA